MVGIHAHTIDILTENGEILTTHRRAFGDSRTDTSDYSTSLAMLMKNSGAWSNSGLRRETPDLLRTYMDAQPRNKLKDCLRIMNELTDQYGFRTAVDAMEKAILTPKMKGDFYSHVLETGRQLSLNRKIPEKCPSKKRITDSRTL